VTDQYKKPITEAPPVDRVRWALARTNYGYGLTHFNAGYVLTYAEATHLHRAETVLAWADACIAASAGAGPHWWPEPLPAPGWPGHDAAVVARHEGFFRAACPPLRAADIDDVAERVIFDSWEAGAPLAADAEGADLASLDRMELRRYWHVVGTAEAYMDRDTAAHPMHLHLVDTTDFTLRITIDPGAQSMQITGVVVLDDAEVDAVEATIAGVDTWTVKAAVDAWFAAVAPVGVERRRLWT